MRARLRLYTLSTYSLLSFLSYYLGPDWAFAGPRVGPFRAHELSNKLMEKRLNHLHPGSTTPPADSCLFWHLHRRPETVGFVGM